LEFYILVEEAIEGDNLFEYYLKRVELSLQDGYV